MKICLRFILYILIVAVCYPAYSQDAWKKRLSRQCYHSGKDSLPYRLYVPANIKPGEKLPLVLFLHGAGERGSDNEAQLTHGVVHFMNDTILQQFPCYLVVPQCPLNARWVEVDWTEPSHTMPPISVPLKMTFSLLDSLLSQFPVDTNRIYVTGLSMGGFGTWDALSRRPGFFAAAMPVCGGGDEKEACNIKCVPIRAFHGKLDHLVMPARSINMVNAVNQCIDPLNDPCKNPAELILFDKLGHLCWEKVYSNVENIRWLFLQNKQK